MVKRRSLKGPPARVICSTEWLEILKTDARFKPYFALKFDDYLLDDMIGAGATAVVYSAWSNLDKRRVAIKILKDYFPREAFNIIGLQLVNFDFHANHVLPIFGMGLTDRGSVFIVSELMSCTANDIDFDQITDMEARRESNNILHALRALHRHGATYRDLHSGNILVRNDADGACVLGDLGAMYWPKPVLGYTLLDHYRDGHDMPFMPKLRRMEVVRATHTYRHVHPGRSAKIDALLRIYGLPAVPDN